MQRHHGIGSEEVQGPLIGPKGVIISSEERSRIPHYDGNWPHVDDPGVQLQKSALALMVRKGDDYSAIVEIAARNHRWSRPACQIRKGGDNSAIEEIGRQDPRFCLVQGPGPHIQAPASYMTYKGCEDTWRVQGTSTEIQHHRGN
jgi:hypothetical protein